MAKLYSQIEHLTYDDVLLVPQLSLESRNSADISQSIEGINVAHPIIPANMDTISDVGLCQKQIESGGIAILHRYLSSVQRLEAWRQLHITGRFFLSIGVNEPEIVDSLLKYGVTRFCIDIAHGHAESVKKTIEQIKSYDSNIIVIAGNIATIEGFQYLVDAGANIIKIGIGPGSHCTTRIVTGCGVPQFTAVFEIVAYKKRCGLSNPIIADGGLKTSGDITKALAAGAELVMTGSLFAGCTEAPGEIVSGLDGQRYKIYRGMASKDAQVGWKQDLNKDKIVAEGEASMVLCKGPFDLQLHQLCGGIKSGMSYVGASNLIQLYDKAVFLKVSSNTIIENGPHGKSK
jgi:IMP dehydrogenase